MKFLSNLANRLINRPVIEHLDGCTVYFRDDQIYIFPAYTTETGLGIAGDEKIKCPRNSAVRIVGENILKAINNSRSNVANPGDTKIVTKSILDFAKVKNWKEFAKNAIMVEIQRDGSSINITPTRLTRHFSFDRILEERIIVDTEAEKIGKEVCRLVET